jgi:hypothetical protein
VDTPTWAALEAQETAQREREARRAVFHAQWAVNGSTRPQEALEALWGPRIQDDLAELAGTTTGNRHDAIWLIAQRIASLAHAVDAAARARPALEAVAVALLPAGRQDEAIRRVAEGWRDGQANPRPGVIRPR